MNKISKLILAGALVLGIGCGGEEAPAEPAAAAAAPAAAAPAAAAPAAAAPAAGGGGVCERAAACCTGYIEAMVALSPAMAGSLNAETTCSGVRQAGCGGRGGRARLPGGDRRLASGPRGHARRDGPRGVSVRRSGSL
jgi:pyruvate/2-oxoglutarate dehydrogenase complex dihydrolipoamide acyltransferase (E2) component